MTKTNTAIALIYLASITTANLVITALGPVATIPMAFLLIGLDLTCRDYLHESWKDGYLWTKMLTLIFLGSLAAFIINSAALQVAAGSFIAFAAAGIIDTLVYQKLVDRSFLVKINSSNALSALTDSLLFTTIAFGKFLPFVIAGQFLAKTAGGAVWSLVAERVLK